MSKATVSVVKPLVVPAGVFSLSGTKAADWLQGGVTRNTLKGGLGADTLEGLGGNDLYLVDNPDDVVLEGKGAGIDSVVSTVSYRLPQHVENIRLTGKDSIDGLGNELDNVLVGNAGNNVLDGGEGIDTVSYRWSRGPVRIDLSSEAPQKTREGGDIDTLLHIERVMGSRYDDHLIGHEGRNTLTGGQGADTLEGGAGSDRLIGGGGQDCFVLCHPDGTDTLVDYVPGYDRICIDQTHLPLGDQDEIIEQAIVVRGLQSFSPKAEFVRFATELHGRFDTESAAALIRSADQFFTLGHTALFLLENDTETTGIFYFKASDTDNRVAEHELKLIGVVQATGLDVAEFNLIS